MKIFWKIFAAVLAATAVYFVAIGNYERAFVAAAAGACCWLLSYRAQLKDKLNRDDADRRNAIQEDQNEGDTVEEDL